MNLPTEVFGDVMVAHTPDEMGREQAAGIEAFLISQERSRMIVDLDGTESLSSAGLEALLAAQDALRELGGDVKISVTNKANRKILEITRLDERLEVFDSVIDAVKSFN